METIATSASDMAGSGLLPDAETLLSRISIASTLEEAVSSADFIQENITERAEPKQALFSDIEKLARPEAIISSSTSAILPSILFGALKTRERCLVAHPMNPPHLAPIVEMCGAEFTSPRVIGEASNFMAGCGMAPIRVRKEIDGFILNRLQLAVLNEAFRLISRGYVSAADLDKTLCEGLALRWSFMGPIETADLNAPEGIADYMRRYGPTIKRVGEQQAADPDWPADIGETLDAELRQRWPRGGLAAKQAWRDRRMMAMAAHKRSAGRDIPK